TVLRPATLPPSACTNPAANSTATDYTTTPPTYYAGDPGVRNPTIFAGFPTGTYPGSLATGTGVLSTPWGTTYNPSYPPPVPAVRLFQPPDAYAGGPPIALTTPPPVPINSGASNAGDSGDPYVNNVNPVGASATTNMPYTQPGTVAPPSYVNAG